MGSIVPNRDRGSKRHILRFESVTLTIQASICRCQKINHIEEKRREKKGGEEEEDRNYHVSFAIRSLSSSLRSSDKDGEEEMLDNKTESM